MKNITRTIAGHKITLVEGARYVASRPMASRFVKRHQKKFPVAIQPSIGQPPGMIGVTIEGLDYDQSNKLINAFNNGKTSFEGRIWK
jgi:hypothetical protein